MPLDAVAFVWDHCLLDGWPAEFPVFLADVLRLLRNQLLAAADEHALRVALIDAGPGRKARLDITELALASGDLVKLYDGRQTEHVLLKMTGSNLPPQGIESSGRYMLVQMIG